MDRHGQTRALRVAAGAHAPALAALVVAAHERAPAWALALCALCGGATLPQLPAAMRSLWTALVEDDDQCETAYALVSIVFELAVVTAPALVAAIVAIGSPDTAVLAAAGLAFSAALGFTATAASLRWPGTRHEVGSLGPLKAPGMRTVAGALVAFGTALGIVQVAVPAFAADRGSAATGGLLLAALSAGSLAGGLLYGARVWPGSAARRFPPLLLGLAGAYALLAVAGSELALAALLVLCGVLLAPTTIAGSTLLDTVAPEGTVTEAFSVLVMAIVIGSAVGNAVGGQLVDGASYAAAVLIAGAVTAAGAAFSAARHRTLAAAPAAGSDGPLWSPR
jgi:predicted MFS family arabinose efflux permease